MRDSDKTRLKIIGCLVVLLAIFYVIDTYRKAWEPSGTEKLTDINISIIEGLPGRNFPDRKWLHRVNSIERLKYADSRYTGIEIDVVFDEKNHFFDVYHYPDVSKGLSLDTLIAAMTKPEKHYYWIDFKNLTNENKLAASQELFRIAIKYNILTNIIVESENPRCLDDFSRLGFYTSYYLPNINPYQISAKELETYIKTIAANLTSNPTNAVSAQEIQYELIKKYLYNFDILLWNFTDNPISLKLREHRLLKDPKVKVLLID